MSDLYFWFFVSSLGIACLGSMGYNFFGETDSGRRITWSLWFGWFMYWTTIAWLLSLTLYFATNLVGHNWFGETKPWWELLLYAFTGIVMIGFFGWLGRRISDLLRPKKAEDDLNAQRENLGWDGHPIP